MRFRNVAKIGNIRRWENASRRHNRYRRYARPLPTGRSPVRQTGSRDRSPIGAAQPQEGSQW